jgi:protein CpxP
MIRVRSLTVGAVVAGLLAVGAAASAQGPSGRRGPDRFDGLGIGRLDLSETQRQQVQEVAERYRADTRAAVDRIQAARDEQRKAVETVPLNEGQIRATTQALAEAQTELALQQARMRSEIFQLLTPEQQAEAQRLQQLRQTRMEQRRERLQQRLQERRPQRQG